MKMIDLCDKHPRYKAHRRPKSKCKSCMAIHKQTHPKLPWTKVPVYALKILRGEQ